MTRKTTILTTTNNYYFLMEPNPNHMAIMHERFVLSLCLFVYYVWTNGSIICQILFYVNMLGMSLRLQVGIYLSNERCLSARRTGTKIANGPIKMLHATESRDSLLRELSISTSHHNPLDDHLARGTLAGRSSLPLLYQLFRRYWCFESLS